MEKEYKAAVNKFFAALDRAANKYLENMADCNAPAFELTEKAAEKLFDLAWQLAAGCNRPTAFVVRVVNSYAATSFDPAALMELIEERASEIEDGGRGYRKAGGGWWFVVENDDADPVYWHGHNVYNGRGVCVGWTFNRNPLDPDAFE